MNIKKLFAVLAGVSMLAQTVVPSAGVFGAEYSEELQGAYNWAYSKGVTTMSSIDNANMYGAITRAEMAKMLSVYAESSLGITADTSKACTFTDIDSVKGDLHDFIIKSCQLGIMGQGITAFRPYDTLSRAEFGTALSRVLWGDKYEGGTPYYANHLNALKAAGIMNQIANAESTKEVRGYVMLMLQRSEGSDAVVDCDDPVVALACSLDTDECPAACKEGSKEDDNKVVKSGDLAVTAKAADGRKALIGWVSDLDTITFKTSEEVTISSITLERYGYSTKEQVKSVQLEDEDGNIIADAKELNNKGQVKLTLKKDYKTVDGTFRATVVVTTIDGQAESTDPKFSNGSTIGFKVVAAESTAKNLNLDDYDPYTYDLVSYAGSAVQFSSRNSGTKSYNWEAGELYEVAKFRVKAPSDAAILVKGFTLTDNEENKIEADKYVKDVTVTVNWEKVDWLKWNINKDEELVVSFDEIEVAGKETATIAVNMSFNEEFDNFNSSVSYYIKQLSNFNATDKKTGTRVSQDESNGKAYTIETLAGKIGIANGWNTYIFKWGKIKISGTKLGTVNAAANSSNVKVAEWEITITEALRGTAVIGVASNDVIDEIRLVINGEEYDGTKLSSTDYVATKAYSKWALVKKDAKYYVITEALKAVEEARAWNTVKAIEVTSAYQFKGLEIEKSGKIEVRVDVKEDTEGTMSFAGSLNSASFDLKYDESGNSVDDQLIWSVSLSDLKVQAAKASIENKLTKDVELIKWETNRKTIFEGTYEAKKGAVTLKEFTITSTKDGGTINMAKAPTFYVTINGEEYDADWNTTSKKARQDIDDIKVADGKSVNVKVEIEVAPALASDDTNDTFNIAFAWEDEDNNPAGTANDDTVKVKVVAQGTLNVNSSARNTVLLASDRSLAEFTIKPSKSGDEDVILKTLTFRLNDASTNVYWSTTSPVLKVVVDGDDISNELDTSVDGYVTYNPSINVPSAWVVVKVSFKSEQSWEKKLVLTDVNTNDHSLTREFKKNYQPSLLKITQKKDGDITKYNIDVEKDDSSTTVSDLVFYVDGASSCSAVITPATTNDPEKITPTNCESFSIISGVLSDTENSWEATNDTKAKTVRYMAYKVNGSYVLLSRANYEDYFNVNDGALKVYSNSNN